MNSAQIEEYLKNLISNIRLEKNLWKKSHCHYGDPELEQTSWEAVTRAMNIHCNTEQITVHDVKCSWRCLLEAYEECKQNITAITFSLFYHVMFTDKHYNSSYRKRFEFNRKNGKLLIWLQIIANICFFGVGLIMLVRTLCLKATAVQVQFSEFSANLIAMTMIAYTIDDEVESIPKKSANDVKENYTPLKKIVVTGLISTFLTFIMSCFPPIINDDQQLVTLYCALFFTRLTISQRSTISAHLFKLERPPTKNEMFTLLITQLILLVLLTVPLFNSQWIEFYLFNSAWVFINSIILLIYYDRCISNANTLYKYHIPRKLIYVSTKENPYEIRIEMKEGKEIL